MKDQETRIAELERRVADLERLLRTNGKTIAEMADSKEYLLEVQTAKPEAKGAFQEFWKAYPKKAGKGAAEKAWKKAKNRPSIQAILAAIATQKRSEQWQKDGGQYIPNPATWLNQGRWEDELPMEAASTNGYHSAPEQPMRRQMTL